MKHPTALLGKIIPTLLFILLTPLSIIYVPASRTIRKLRECCRLPLWQRSRGTTTDRQERTTANTAEQAERQRHEKRKKMTRGDRTTSAKSKKDNPKPQ